MSCDPEDEKKFGCFGNIRRDCSDGRRPYCFTTDRKEFQP